MSVAHKLLAWSLPVLVVTVPGCSWNGLRSLVSRDETAGYKTLAEREAEEAQTAEAGVSQAGPRFASWLPLVGDKSAARNSVTAREPAESDPASTSWRNPFRKRGDAELNPFLTAQASDDKPSSQSAPQEATAESLVSAASGRNKTGNTDPLIQRTGFDSLVTDVENVRQAVQQDSGAAADDAARFEELLLTSPAEETADDNQLTDAGSDDAVATPLLTKRPGSNVPAGKDAAAARRNPAQTAARLAQLEQLLNERRAEARKAKADVTEAAKKSAADTTTALRTRAFEATESGFDELLGLTAGNEARQPVAQRAAATASELWESASGSTPQSGEVAVEAAKALFGDAVRDVVDQANGAVPESVRAIARADWSPDALRETGARWLDSKVDQALESATGRTAEELNTAADRIVGLLPGARRTSAGQRSGQNDATGRSGALQLATSSNPMFDEAESVTDASLTTVSALAEPGDPDDAPAADPFVADTGVTVAVTAPAAPVEASGSSRSGFLMTWRNWLLLVGGIIVVALLFAPDRKSGTASAAVAEGK